MVSAEPNAPQTKKASSATAKKPRTPSKASPKKTARPTKTATEPTKAKKAHPTYLAMITKAIRDLKKRDGASLSAIRLYIMKQFDVGVSSSTTAMNTGIRQAIKRGLESGQFVQVKGVGMNGSFRLGDAAKKEAQKAAKKEAKTAKKEAEDAPEAVQPKPKKAPAAKKVTEGPKGKAVAKMVMAAAEKKSATKSPVKKKTAATTKTKTAATKMSKSPKSPKSPAKTKKTAANKMPKAPKVKSAKASPMKKVAAKA